MCTAQLRNGGRVPRVAEIALDGFDRRCTWSANWVVEPRPCCMPPGTKHTEAHPNAPTKLLRRRSPALAQPTLDWGCPCPGNRECDLARATHHATSIIGISVKSAIPGTQGRAGQSGPPCGETSIARVQQVLRTRHRHGKPCFGFWNTDWMSKYSLGIPFNNLLDIPF
jgi:hypothetical protein